MNYNYWLTGHCKQISFSCNYVDECPMPIQRTHLLGDKEILKMALVSSGKETFHTITEKPELYSDDEAFLNATELFIKK